ncbi:hypothetical protein K458DRAFT_295428 [Lentithecium fluviatile CBS 122367]|uniref:DNA replication regulator SLD2 n=1 Tax=Lentithecium fluviatile CBS 122367 TaxID=1168545 RepID=A0A6G1JC38_9PLEO|nr:hypothetical protein K458DRAFT_295428 [Lentithecium fluviatile CBS 122367]
MSNTELEQRCNMLRVELKVWEKKFAAAHQGRKAGRDDIKADVIISQKYKEYSKVRDILSGKAGPQTPSKRATNRKASRDLDRTPAAPRIFVAARTTPLKRKREDDGLFVEAVASPSQVLSPQGPAFIGPTPQRDGLVLGLFDLLPASTPSKTRTALHEVVPNLLHTPSKPLKKAESDGSFESRGRYEKTPQSTGKRFLLDQFVTPNKIKLGESGTPTSTLKGFSTPAFLRRDNFLAPIDEANESTPRPAPWKRRSLGRSLSEMIQSMRKQEEDRLDEEADIMLEMEMEEVGIQMPKKQPIPDVLVEDSQAVMPLGPDRSLESDEEDKDEAEEQLGADGKPRRVWKKKGLKRQTRRVIMRPHFVGPKPEAQHPHDEESDGNAEGVAETQQPDAGNLASGDEYPDDDDESDYASDDSHSRKKRKTQKKKKKKPVNDSSKSQPTETEGKEGPVKTVARKIKATAHANYRRLKIKSKGGNGGKGKFGRRRPETTWGPSAARAPTLPPPPAALKTTPKHTTPHRPFAPTNKPVPKPSPTPILSPSAMAERELQDVLKQLHQALQSHKYQQSTSLLSRAKVALLGLNALIPSESTPKKSLLLARETLELGALHSIRLKDPVSFTRYFQQLQPFYALPEEVLPKENGNSSKITGLYLLLLLSDGDYAGFHTLLETLEVAAAQSGKGLEEDAFVQYPIRLERALMEGSYDRVWGETKSERVPSEEFGLFSEVLIGTIRKEIASCSEKAYPSIPISDAKSLLFLDSEGSVVKFAQELGWVVKDGRIYFPAQDDEYQSRDIMVTSDQVIENALGYARELETIV